jgi:hypothetical protein
MCYSAPVSLLTFTLGFGFSVLLTFQKATFHRLLGYFLGFVSLMQLIEYLLWVHPVCDDYNKTLSVAGMILNHLQPVVLAVITGLLYGKHIPALLAISVFYLATIIPYSLQFTSDLQCTTRQCTTRQCSSDPHLVWNWNTLEYSRWAYLVFLASFAGIGLLGMPSSEGRIFALVSVVTYTLSAWIYDRKVMGSLWCFWTALMPPLIYATSIQ